MNHRELAETAAGIVRDFETGADGERVKTAMFMTACQALHEGRPLHTVRTMAQKAGERARCSR